MSPYKKCSCGGFYSMAEWDALPDAGIQKTEDDTHVFYLEMKNCPKCGSTIGIETSVPKKGLKKDSC